MATGRYYVDTSAYLCVLLGETGGERIARELHGGHLLSSTLLALEAERTLVQLSRAGRLSPEDVQTAVEQLGRDLSQFVLRDLTLDLAHLRTALWFHEREPLKRFVSLDAAQTQAARELGLPL